MIKRIPSGILAGSILAALLFLMTLLALPALLDSNAVKGQIAQIFKKRTGRSLVIEGDLKFSFLPEAKITLGRTHIDNPEGFSQPSMAVFQGATLTVRGLGLLFGQLDVRELAINDLELTLERNPNGVTNWPELPADLITTTEWYPSQTGQSTPDKFADTLAARIGLAVFATVNKGGIQLQGAKIHWHDNMKGTHYSLDNVAVVSRSMGAGALGLELNGNWKRHHDDLHGRISLNYDAHDNNETLDLKHLHLFLSSQSNQIFLREAEFRVTADVTLDLQHRHVVLHDLEAGVSGWFTRYSLRDLAAVVKGTAEWDIDQAVGTMADARVSLKAHSDTLPPAGVDVRIRSGLNWQSQTDVLTLTGLHAEGPAAMRLQGDFLVRGIKGGADALAVNGQLHTEPFDPKALFIAMGQPLPRVMNTQNLVKGVLDATFQADRNGLRVDPFKLDLDATRMEGNVVWQGVSHPEIRFAVALDHIEVDRYWGLLPGIDKTTENKPLLAMLLPELSLAGLFGRLPKDLNVEGSLTSQAMQVSGAALEDFQLTMKAGDGVLTLDPFRFKLYQGEWKQKIQVDNRLADSKLLVEKEMKGIQILPFLSDIAAVNWLSGTMDLSGQVETSGKDSLTARKNLKGSYWLGMKNGLLQGVDLTESIRQIAVAVDGRPAKTVADETSSSPAQPGTTQPSTMISELTATARVGQGRLINNDLLAISHSSIIKGKGEANLVDMSVDYTFTADAQAALKGMNIPYWDRLEGAVLPIHIVGPIPLLKKPSLGEPQLTRRLMAAKQSHQGDSNPIGQSQQPYVDGPPFSNPVVDAAQRNRRPMTRWSHGLFP
ncbi:MAG: AsmA family protein [Magnetococcales bacterium]|nr:AsmA family protein [Magnetococcales bacterium]